MKQLLPSVPLNQPKKELLEPALPSDAETLSALKSGRSGQILKCLKKQTLKPHPKVLTLLMERLAQERQSNCLDATINNK